MHKHSSMIMPCNNAPASCEQRTSIAEQYGNAARYEQMDDEFIGEHGIRLDFVTKTSSNVRKQMVYFPQKETKMQKKNNDIL